MKLGANKIPILTFHALEDSSAAISFPPARFRELIEKCYAAGWRTISLSDAAHQLREMRQLAEKSFVITFDDGYASVYRHAFPILQTHNLTATIFIAPNEKTTGDMALPTLHNREMLRWTEIREMRAYGLHFGAHSLTHCDLTRLDDAGVTAQVQGSQALLASALGENISLFCYPFGKYNRRVKEITAQFFDVACSDALGIANFHSDLHALERVETFYLRSSWAADALTHSWFPSYLTACNIPRRIRRLMQR